MFGKTLTINYLIMYIKIPVKGIYVNICNLLSIGYCSGFVARKTTNFIYKSIIG